MKRIALVLAHPDDAEIWAGGTILNHSRQGDRILVTYLFAPSSERRQEALQLGDLPHTNITFADSTGEIRRALSDFQPDVVITHWEKDAHPDHRSTYHVVLDLVPCLMIEDKLRFSFYSCDTYNSLGSAPSDVLIPSVYVDVTANWKRKIELISRHKSQPVEYWIQMITRQNVLHGARANCTYAEAFVRVNTLGHINRADDLLA